LEESARLTGLQFKDQETFISKENTLSKSLNNYEIFRGKVVNDFQPKGQVNISKTKDKQVKPIDKKKLLNF
jgi:hypothetical protein